MTTQLWIVADRGDDSPGLYQTPEDLPFGRQECGCCYTFGSRTQAVVHALGIMRNLQKNLTAELAICENIIVSYERELRRGEINR